MLFLHWKLCWVHLSNQIKLHIKSEATQHNKHGQETNDADTGWTRWTPVLRCGCVAWTHVTKSQLRNQNLKAYAQTKAGGLSRAPDTHWLSGQSTVSLAYRSLDPIQSCQTCPGWARLPLRLKTAVPTIKPQDRTLSRLSLISQQVINATSL